MKIVSYLLAFATLCIALAAAQKGHAHEGHAALPSTGVTLDGNQLLISQTAIDAIEMKTHMIKLGDIQHKLYVNGRVDLPWSGQAKVTTLTSGKIEQVLVKPGQAVDAGQELAHVASVELESLQTELLQAAAEVNLLGRLIRQREPLVASGGIEAKVLLQSRSELQQKRAKYAVAYQKLQALGINKSAIDAVQRSGQTIRSIPVVSPIAGTVESIDTRPGQLVESTEHLFDIVDLSTLYVVGEVLEGDAYLVHDGLPVSFSVAGPSNVTVTGHIDHIRMKIDESKRSLEAVVVVDNDERLLRPGMFGRMTIEVATAKQEIVCPRSALIETESGTIVLKRESEGKFSRQPVTIGMRSPDRIVVKTGLFPGQLVISHGTHLLASMFNGVPLPKSPSGRRPTEEPKSLVSKPSQPSSEHHVLAARAVVELPTSQKAVATSLIEGQVATISVRHGQVVEAGDTLAEVESQKLRGLQLELLQAAASANWTQGEVNRLRPLAETGVTSSREFWQRELELRTLSQQVASLKRRLSLIGLPEEEIESLCSGELNVADGDATETGRIAIRSPISGRVAHIGLTIGQIVHAHDSLFEIHDTSTIWIKALVLENDAAQIELNQQAVATFPANPNLRVSGAVVRLAPQLVSRERVLPLWIELPNPQGFLKDGMLARVQINVPEPPTTVAARTILAN